MKRINIVGVPEHFNLPWHLAIEEGLFAQAGIDLNWTDVPEGTGRMCQMLQDGEADLAVILTEGITKSIIEGNPVRIIQEYIGSPLLWGIHVAAESDLQNTEELEGRTAAVSRIGSGSHLMTYLLAMDHGWDTAELKFEIVNNIEGAVKALTAGTSDYFLWERFTTKPLVDRGIFRRLGDYPTPWPCFVLAAREQSINENTPAIRLILDIINRISTEFRWIPSIDRTLANRYGQKQEDIQIWLSKTRWSQSQISLQDINNVIVALYNLKLINRKVSADQLLTTL